MFTRRHPTDGDTPESNGSGAPPAPPHNEDMQDQVARLAKERDEAVTQWKRALADFQNYQRRADANEKEARRQGSIGVVSSILPVLDHFDLALAQPAPDEASRRILDGVKVIREELLRVLELHGVKLINPEPGEEFDPNRHSAIMQQEAPGVKPGHVSAAFQLGYALGERVIRSAKVAVAPAAPASAPESKVDFGKPNSEGEYNLDE